MSVFILNQFLAVMGNSWNRIKLVAPRLPASAAQCRAEVPSGVVVYTGILSSTSSLRSCAASPLEAHWCSSDVRTAGEAATLRERGRCGAGAPLVALGRVAAALVVGEATLGGTTPGGPPSLGFPAEQKHSYTHTVSVSLSEELLQQTKPACNKLWSDFLVRTKSFANRQVFPKLLFFFWSICDNICVP